MTIREAAIAADFVLSTIAGVAALRAWWRGDIPRATLYAVVAFGADIMMRVR